MRGGGYGEVFLTQGDKAAMKLYMAGGVTANLNPFWKETCKRMEQGQTYENATEDSMRIFLAGGGVKALDSGRTPRNSKKKKKRSRDASIHCRDSGEPERIRCRCSYISREYGPGEAGGGYDSTVIEYRPYILGSFFYCDADTERLLPHFGDFLLDSGAFTFMMGKGGSPNWDEYVERYADFINRNNVQKYFELDIDSVVGYDRVKEIRRKLERLTNRPTIPVWHISRGLEEYKRMCDEYDYVAIGGIVSGEIKNTKYGAFPSLIAEAHKRGAKVHGLGFTALDWLKVCHFDSVDSTAWTTGNRFGYLYYFDGHTMRKKDVPKGHRLGDSRAAALNNYTEWIKFQKWAETHL